MNSFAEVAGHELLVQSLQKSINANMVAHAYLFVGDKGIGKMTTAKAFAKTLQCEQKGLEPCGSCVSCKTFDSGNNPDVVYVEKSKTRLGIDDIREQVIKSLEVKVYRSPYKIFMIPEAHTMTEQAQNTLLKTLEEPVCDAVFILLAEHIYGFLSTVLSRCIIKKFKPLSDADVLYYLKNYEFELPADIIAAYAQGNIGKALLLAESDDFLAMRSSVFDIILKIEEADITTLYECAKTLENYKDQIQDVLDMLLICFRDMMLKTLGAADKIIMKDQMLFFGQQRNANLEPLIRVCEAVIHAKKTIMQNGNLVLTLEMLMMQIKGELYGRGSWYPVSESR